MMDQGFRALRVVALSSGREPASHAGWVPSADALMQVVLEISNGKANLKQIILKGDTVIGRSPDCQLKIASSQVSRRHCRIAIREPKVSIRDLGSANGTFVDGKQVPTEKDILLKPGASVVVGPLKFVVKYDSTLAKVAAGKTAVAPRQSAPPAAPPAPAASEPDELEPEILSATGEPEDDFFGSGGAAADADDATLMADAMPDLHDSAAPADEFHFDGTPALGAAEVEAPDVEIDDEEVAAAPAVTPAKPVKTKPDQKAPPAKAEKPKRSFFDFLGLKGKKKPEEPAAAPVAAVAAVPVPAIADEPAGATTDESLHPGEPDAEAAEVTAPAEVAAEADAPFPGFGDDSHAEEHDPHGHGSHGDDMGDEDFNKFFGQLN